MKGLYQNSKHILYRLAFIIACLLSTFQTDASEPVAFKPWVILVESEIDPRASLHVAKGMLEAEAQGATHIILKINTFGGALEDAEKIRNLLIDAKIPVWAFIDKNAASAGALIAISCDSIYMTPGANIGAATVVDGEGKPAADKYQSYMRSLMRSTAEVTKRDPAIAEGMVGLPLQHDSSTIGHVISYTTAEAVHNGYCDAEVNSIEDLLALHKLPFSSIHTYQPGTTDKIIGFFMHPALRGLLMLLIIAGIYFELQTPGIGFPLAAAVVGIILYFIPSYLSGLTENWEIVLFFIGVLLLFAELFLIPGFGIAGVSGIILMFASLILVSVNNQLFDFTFVPQADLEYLLLMTALCTCGLFVLAMTLGKRILNNSYFKKITLQEQQLSTDGYTSSTVVNVIGERGVAFTDLRPSGKVRVGDKLYDAYTNGEFIEANRTVEIKEQSLGSLKVKEVQND